MTYLRFITYEGLTIITLCITAINGVASAGVCDCGGDWVGRPVTNGCHCYQGFTDQVKEWSVARDLCQQHGGDLASITSTDEYEFIGQYLSGIEDFTTWWVGLTKGGDGVWKWSTGEQLSEDIEVSDGTGSSTDGCGDIDVFSAFIEVWKTPCTGSESKNYVCEVTLLETTTSDLLHTTSDAFATSDRVTTTDAITTSQQVTTSGAQTTSQQVTTSGAQTTSQQVTTSDAITTSQQVTISDAITTSQQVTTSGAQTTSQQVSTSDAQTTSQQVTTSGVQTTSQQVTTSDAQTTSQQVTTSDIQTTSQQVTTSDIQTTSQQVTTSDVQTTSQQVTTSDAITITQLVTTSDAIRTTQLVTTSDAITTVGQVTTTKTTENSNTLDNNAPDDDTVYLYTIVTGGIVLIFTILSLTVCYVAKAKYRQISPLESRPVRHTNQHSTSGITMPSKPRFPTPPKRVNTNLFDIGDRNIIPSPLPQNNTSIDSKLTQNSQTVTDNFNVSTVSKGLPMPPACTREPTLPPKDTAQSTSETKNMSDLFNRPGSLHPPHHELTAQTKADPLIDVEDSE